MKQKSLFKGDDQFPKFVVEINGEKDKNIIISLIQDWIKRKGPNMEIQSVGINIYRLADLNVTIRIKEKNKYLKVKRV